MSGALKSAAARGPHRWHPIGSDDYTKAMNVPGGALVRTSIYYNGTSGTALTLVPGVMVNSRWRVENGEAWRESRLSWAVGLEDGWSLAEDLGPMPESESET